MAFCSHQILPRIEAAGFNRRMRKTARPVVWEGDGAQSPSLDPIEGARPTGSPPAVVKTWVGQDTSQPQPFTAGAARNASVSGAAIPQRSLLAGQGI